MTGSSAYSRASSRAYSRFESWLRCGAVAYGKRGAILLVVWVSIVAIADFAAAQSAETSIAQQLSVLLESNKVHDLRKAAEMIEKDPIEALPFLATVTRRANHPELTKVFALLVRYAPDQELDRVMKSAAERQRIVLADEQGARRSGIRAQLKTSASQRPIDRSPVAPVQAASGQETSGQETSGLDTTARNAPAFTAPPNGGASSKSENRGAMQSIVEKENAKETIGLPEIFARLSEMQTRPDLQDDDWELLFALMDGEHFENEAAIKNTNGVPDRRLMFVCSNQAEVLARKIEPGAQLASVRWIAETAEKSDYPMQYLRVLDAYECELSDAAPFLKRMLDVCDDPKDKLILYRLYYLADGDAFGALAALEHAIKAPTKDWETIHLACLGIEELGPKARKLLPRLIQLAGEAEKDSDRVKVIKAIGAIGPDASSAIQDLFQLYRKNIDEDLYWFQYRREEIIRAFGAMGPEAKETVPLLMSLARRSSPESSNARNAAISALIKIAPDEPDVREIMDMLSKDPTVNPYFKKQILEYLGN